MPGNGKPRKGGGGGSGGSGGGAALPDGVKVEEYGSTKDYVFEVSGSEVRFSVGGLGANKAEVDYQVNGNFDRSSLKGRDANKVALKIARIMKYDVATRPKGFKYSVSAYTGDGFGDRRAQAYRLAGFSTPRKAGDLQYAVVKGGKLQPIKEAQF